MDKLYSITMELSVDIIRLAKRLRKNDEHIISDQIARSATSVGANYSEAKYASSPADFVNKLRIALKEANETGYWLELLRQTDYIGNDEYSDLQDKCKKIKVLLIKSINTAVENNHLS